MRFRRYVVALVVVVAGLVASAPLVASAGPASAADRFGAEASAFGLDAAARRELQQRVDSYLAATGGTQVAANRVDLDGGFVLLALPGESRVRGAKTGPVPNIAPGCPTQYLCGYSSPNYDGDMFAQIRCGRAVYIGWTGVGSYANVQTSGTRAVFVHDDGHRSGSVAVVYRPSYNWDPVNHVIAC